jgi:hypothetical protein
MQFMSAGGNNSSLVYRMLANSGLLMSVFGFLSFVCMFCLFAMVIIMTQLRCHFADKFYLRAIAGVLVAIVLLFHLFFMDQFRKINPLSMVKWSGFGAPWINMSKSSREEVKRLGSIFLSDAQAAVLASLDEDQDGVVDALQDTPQQKKLGKKWEAMMHFVEEALPELQDEEGQLRLKLITDAMIGQRIALERLVDAAQLPGGFHVLFEMFAFKDDVTLSQGERLALASAAMKTGASKSNTISSLSS